VRQYLDEIKRKAAAQGYLRRCWAQALLPGPASTDNRPPGRGERRAAEREAVNYPIQGTAADIIKLAMLRLHDALASASSPQHDPQVHDELVLEVPEHEVDVTSALVKEVMERLPARRPLRADVSHRPQLGRSKMMPITDC